MPKGCPLDPILEVSNAYHSSYKCWCSPVRQIYLAENINITFFRRNEFSMYRTTAWRPEQNTKLNVMEWVCRQKRYGRRKRSFLWNKFSGPGREHIFPRYTLKLKIFKLHLISLVQYALIQFEKYFSVKRRGIIIRNSKIHKRHAELFRKSLHDRQPRTSARTRGSWNETYRSWRKNPTLLSGIMIWNHAKTIQFDFLGTPGFRSNHSPIEVSCILPFGWLIGTGIEIGHISDLGCGVGLVKLQHVTCSESPNSVMESMWHANVKQNESGQCMFQS